MVPLRLRESDRGAQGQVVLSTLCAAHERKLGRKGQRRLRQRFGSAAQEEEKD